MGSNTEVAVGTDSVATGWGDTKFTGDNQFLQQVTLPVISQTVCRGYYSPSQVKDDMVCAGLREGGKDTCQGDSGGPLVYLNEDNGRWQLLGLTRWGIGCALPGRPGVYSKVKYHLDWIKETSGVSP